MLTSFLRGQPLIDDDGGVGPYTTLADAAANTFGAWTTLFASLSHDIDGLLLGLHLHFNATWFVEIGIGAGPTVVVPRLYFDTSNGSGNTSIGPIYIPIRIKKGSLVQMRVQKSDAATFEKGKLWGIPSTVSAVRGVSRWVAYGNVDGSTQGTQLTPGNGVKGAWVQLSAGIDPGMRWMIICADIPTGTLNDGRLDVAIGPTKEIIAPNLTWTNEDSKSLFTLLPLRVPKGTEIWARGQDEGAGTMTCIVIGGM